MSKKIKLQFKYLGAGAFALLFLIFNIIQANDLIIRDENGDVTCIISEDGSIRGNKPIEPNAETTPTSNEDLVIRTDDATENQMIFTDSEIKLKGVKVKCEGNDNEIDVGMYFRNSEGEPDKQIQAAVTEIGANLVYRGNFQYQVKPLAKDPLVPGRTNHPVLFVHGFSSNSPSTFDAEPYGFFVKEMGEFTYRIWCENIDDDLSTKKYLAEAEVNLLISSSGGKTFDHKATIRLTEFVAQEGFDPIWAGANIEYDHIHNVLNYELYYGGEDQVFRRGVVPYDINKYLHSLLDNPSQRQIIACSDEVVWYNEKSIPEYLANELELNTSFDKENPSEGINSNGIYFFNAKRPIMNNGAVEYWVWDGFVSPDWNENEEEYGQPNQLVDRMVEVLDKHYGKDAWKDDPDAVIDIVSHSQGGLVTRLAAYHSDSPSLDNPVNHINRIITTGTPHWGSALGTNSYLLGDIGNIDNQGKKYPVFADTKDKLVGIQTAGTIVDVDKFGIPLLVANTLAPFLGCVLPINRAYIKNLKIKGSYLGPFDFSGTVIFITYTPIPIVVIRKEIKFSWDLAKEARNGLKEFQEKSEHLAWRAQENSIIEKMASEVIYPKRWDNNDPISVTHLYSPKAKFFLSSTFDRLRKILKKKMLDYTTIGMVIGGPQVGAIVYDVYNFELDDELNKMANLMWDLDTEWCHDGDVVVETFSQKGINIGTGFNPNDPNKDFATKSFSSTVYKDKITHKNLSKLNPGYSWEARQCYDVARELGVFDEEPVPPSPPGGYLPDSALVQSAFNSSDEIISVSFTNNSEHTLEGFTAEYYATADSAIQPELNVLNSEGISITMNKCGSNIYRVLLDASEITLAPMETFPVSGQIEFQLYYNTGVPWNHFDDYSYFSSEDATFQSNQTIVIRDMSGAIVSGVAPDSAAINRMELPSCLLYSKERADWENPSGVYRTKPSLSLENKGSSEINEIHIFYFFRTPSLPNIVIDILEYPDNASIFLDTMDQNRYALHITFDSISIHPGDRINDINFEISNDDYTLWSFDDDPSFIGSDTPVKNTKVLLIDWKGNRVGGLFPSEIPEMFGPFTAWLDASLESDIPGISRPKIRLQNDGATTLESFKIFYYFTTEDGRIPVCDIISAPGCVVTVENISGNQYQVVFECIYANLEPGEDYFPNSDGIIVELHYDDMNDWDSSNDYSAEVLDNSWTDTKRIVVEDMSGNVLWGEKP